MKRRFHPSLYFYRWYRRIPSSTGNIPLWSFTQHGVNYGGDSDEGDRAAKLRLPLLSVDVLHITRRIDTDYTLTDDVTYHFGDSGTIISKLSEQKKYDLYQTFDRLKGVPLVIPTVRQMMTLSSDGYTLSHCYGSDNEPGSCSSDSRELQDFCISLRLRLPSPSSHYSISQTLFHVRLPVLPKTLEELALVQRWLTELQRSYYLCSFAGGIEPILALNPDFLDVLCPEFRLAVGKLTLEVGGDDQALALARRFVRSYSAHRFLCVFSGGRLDVDPIPTRVFPLLLSFSQPTELAEIAVFWIPTLDSITESLKALGSSGGDGNEDPSLIPVIHRKLPRSIVLDQICPLHTRHCFDPSLRRQRTISIAVPGGSSNLRWVLRERRDGNIELQRIDR